MKNMGNHPPEMTRSNSDSGLIKLFNDKLSPTKVPKSVPNLNEAAKCDSELAKMPRRLRQWGIYSQLTVNGLMRLSQTCKFFKNDVSAFLDEKIKERFSICQLFAPIRRIDLIGEFINRLPQGNLFSSVQPIQAIDTICQQFKKQNNFSDFFAGLIFLYCLQTAVVTTKEQPSQLEIYDKAVTAIIKLKFNDKNQENCYSRLFALENVRLLGTLVFSVFMPNEAPLEDKHQNYGAALKDIISELEKIRKEYYDGFFMLCKNDVCFSKVASHNMTVIFSAMHDNIGHKLLFCRAVTNVFPSFIMKAASSDFDITKFVECIEENHRMDQKPLIFGNK